MKLYFPQVSALFEEKKLQALLSLSLELHVEAEVVILLLVFLIVLLLIFLLTFIPFQLKQLYFKCFMMALCTILHSLAWLLIALKLSKLFLQLHQLP